MLVNDGTRLKMSESWMKGLDSHIRILSELHLDRAPAEDATKTVRYPWYNNKVDSTTFYLTFFIWANIALGCKPMIANWIWKITMTTARLPCVSYFSPECPPICGTVHLSANKTPLKPQYLQIIFHDTQSFYLRFTTLCLHLLGLLLPPTGSKFHEKNNNLSIKEKVQTEGSVHETESITT